mgnify:CR=1 FL=1
MATKKEMIEAVKAHAREHYEEGGWDSIVECYDDEDIIRDMGTATTVEEAIRNVGKLAGIWDEHRKEIISTTF